MAKNKGKGPKPKNVFHVANTKSIKAKNKTKPVMSNLKKINAATSDKVSKVNKAFTALHKDVAQMKKRSAAASKETPGNIARPAPEAPVDVETAAALFSQL
ncbi:ribosomal biogenesis factor isoform X2 [Eleutherodactylus coqui]